MTRFNPNAISTVGNEWRAWRSSGDHQEPIAALIRSTANETIDSVLVPYTATGAQTTPSWGKVWAEIYDLAALGLNETPVEYVYVPNADVAVNAMYYTPIGGALTGPINNSLSNLDQYVNDLTDENFPMADTDSLQFTGGGYTRFAFNTSTLPAGRVLSVQIEVRYPRGIIAAQGMVSVDLYNGTSLVTRLMTASVFLSENTTQQMLTATSALLYLNPLTAEPWSRADVISLSTGTNLMLQVTTVNGTMTVVAVRIKVRMITERRVAIGANTLTTVAGASGGVGGGVNTSNYCVLKTPAGADNWSKATATSYLVVMRRLTDPSGVMPAQTQYFWQVDSGHTNPDNEGGAYAVTIDNDGRLLTATGPSTAAFATIIAKTTGDLSVDSQPYWQLVPGRVYTGVTANQRISNHGSTAYQTINAVIGRSAGVAPNASLTFKVKRVSDNVQLGGTATLTAAQLLENPFLATFAGVNWYDVQVDLSSNATLVAGTQYYVEVASTAAVGTPWWVYALDETHGHAFTADQSYGATTDYALVEGVTQTQMDLVLTLTVPPPAGPASITITTTSYTLPDNGGAACAAGVHSAARVTWAATGEGVLFARYEVQRSEDNGATWVTIKRIATESTVTFDDVTAARGAVLKYRVRTVRTTGLASAWRTQSTTTTLVANTEAVIFATNNNPALTVGFLWLNPQHRYEFLSDREVNVLQLHARDYSVVFRGTENRGVLFTFDLLIYARNLELDYGGLPPAGKGDEAFNALRAIAESNAPSVTVFTPFGKRIFGAVRVPGGDLEAESAVYVTTVQVVQTSASDSVTDI